MKEKIQIFDKTALFNQPTSSLAQGIKFAQRHQNHFGDE